MKRFFKCAFVGVFAVATAFASFESVFASNEGVEICSGGPVDELETKDMICLKCNVQGKIKRGTFIIDGRIFTGLMCFNCMSAVEILP